MVLIVNQEIKHVAAEHYGARAKLDALNLDLIDVKKFAQYFPINVFSKKLKKLKTKNI